jgi:transcriptional antiterminator RfaH
MALWRELSARGFESVYPQLHVRPANPRSRAIRPYFPGYLFVRTDIEQVGASVFQWMPFSGGFVSFGGTPATVPDSLVKAICRHLDQINAAGGELLDGLKHGDLVKIHGGPFHGYECIFDARLPGRERVRVLLNLLESRPVPIELPARQIAILHRSQGRR